MSIEKEKQNLLNHQRKVTLSPCSISNKKHITLFYTLFVESSKQVSSKLLAAINKVTKFQHINS